MAHLWPIYPVLGTFVRLAAATGARRGELAALGWRHVDLAIDALAEHRRRVEAVAAVAASVILLPDAFLFSHSANGSLSVSPDFFTSAWARLRTQLGLEGIRLHDLRHFQATMLLRSGVPVKNASRRIGHRDAATTLNVYAHALEDVDREAADVVGGLLRSPARTSKWTTS